jgi:hypothetical protein
VDTAAVDLVAVDLVAVDNLVELVWTDRGQLRRARDLHPIRLPMWIKLWTTGAQVTAAVDNCRSMVAQPVDILHPCKYQM